MPIWFETNNPPHIREFSFCNVTTATCLRNELSTHVRWPFLLWKRSLQHWSEVHGTCVLIAKSIASSDMSHLEKKRPILSSFVCYPSAYSSVATILVYVLSIISSTLAPIYSQISKYGIKVNHRNGGLLALKSLNASVNFTPLKIEVLCHQTTSVYN